MISVIALILMIISNAFQDIYNVVYPWNILMGAVSSGILAYIAYIDKDKPYLILNVAVAGIYIIGIIFG